MPNVFDFLGDKLVNKAGESLKTASIRGEGKVVALYFSAHWCPPCRGFTPKLGAFYEKVKGRSNGDKFEIVFVSSDRDQEAFAEYLNDMPWWALPFDRRKDKASLSKHFKVSGIPTLVILDGATGKVLNRNGRKAVDSDSEGKNFPWRAKTLYEILQEGEYTNNKDESKSFEEDIKGKVFGVYFSAHWCPPCKMFTPKLSSIYKSVNSETNKFEVIFVSSDQNEEQFKQYHSQMPFLALQYDCDTVKDELNEYFEVDGIPTLVIIGEDGTIITRSGRAALMADQDGKKFPWKPELVEELNTISGAKLNEETCLVYIPGGDEESSNKMKDDMRPLAEASQAKAKLEETSQDLYFIVASPTKNDMLCSLCDFIGANADEKGLIILDLPNAQIYKCEEKEVTKDVLEKFVSDYRAGKLVGNKVGQ